MDAPSGDSDPDERTPRWVWAFAIVGLLLVLAFVILHLAGLAPHHHAP